MMKQRRFTKEFEDEAVRLVTTSGRTQREIAAISPGMTDRQPVPAQRHDNAGACLLGIRDVQRHLRQHAHDVRVAGCWPCYSTPAHGAADARERAARPAEAAVEANHRERARLADRAKHHRPGVPCNGTQPEVERGHLVRLGPRAMAPIWWWSSTSSRAVSSAGPSTTGST